MAEQMAKVGVFAASLILLGVSFQSAQTAPPQRPGNSPLTADGCLKISWVVMQAKQLSRALPEYPDDAKQRGIGGSVRLAIRVDKSGKVSQVEVLSGDPSLGNPAADQVRRWEFQPTLLGGRPACIATELDLKFSHPRGKAQVKCTNDQPAHFSR
jgi:TonB family protein